MDTVAKLCQQEAHLAHEPNREDLIYHNAISRIRSNSLVKVISLLRLALIHLFLILFLSAADTSADTGGGDYPPKDFNWGLSVYGGILFQDSLDEITKGKPRIRESSFILAVALAREIWRFRDWFGFELEGQAVRHFDEMNHWEFNGLLVARWHMFPWDNFVDTSFAIGDGISYATEVPKVEKREDKDAGKWLNYLMFELTLGLPQYPKWDVLFRIHHRSSVQGRIGARDAGSNFFCTGIRYNF
jgi:hypothetical protein